MPSKAEQTTAPFSASTPWKGHTFFTGAALFMVAILPVFLGRVSPFVLLAVSAIFFLLSSLGQRRIHLQLDMVGKTFIGVLAVQIILAALSARTPADIAFGLNFIPLLLYPLMAPLIARAPASPSTDLFGSFALTGAFCAFGVTFYSTVILQRARSDFFVSNVNDLSGLALLFGFLALIGFIGTKKTWRLIFLLGPVLALATIFLTSSRGVLLAYLPLVAVSMWILLPRRFLLPTLTGAILCLVALALLAPIERINSLPQIAMAVISGQFTPDESTNQRIILYIAGVKAFLQAPLFGHGWANFMEAAGTYVPQVPMRENIVGLPQLHNDILNFAATGGIFGVATYLAILGAPLLLLRRVLPAAKHTGTNQTAARALKLGISILVTCYAFRGLTDLMIGFEYGTSFYAMTLALLVGMFTPRRPG